MKKRNRRFFPDSESLRELKADRPGLRFVLAGCMAKAWGKKLIKRIPYLDLVIGPGMLDRIPEYLKFQGRHYPVVDVTDPDAVFSSASRTCRQSTAAQRMGYDHGGMR